MTGAWNWLAGHWPWLAAGGGAVAILAALVVLNPLAAARLFSSVAGFLADAARVCVEWLRKPGNKLKATCAVLAIAAAFGALASYDLNQQVTVISVERDSAVRTRNSAIGERDAARIRVSELETSLAQYRVQEQQFADLQRRRTDELQRLQRENGTVIAEIGRLRASAEASDRAWWRVYEGRTDVCRAAEEALDVACAEVGKF